jgi:hypothetical protein
MEYGMHPDQSKGFTVYLTFLLSVISITPFTFWKNLIWMNFHLYFRLQGKLEQGFWGKRKPEHFYSFVN